MELALQTLDVAASTEAGQRPAAERWPELGVAWAVPEPLGYAELREIIAAGDELADSFERMVAQMARASGALDVALGEGLAALTVGDWLISLGFSCLADYAREVLGVKERKAQDLAHLARELGSRPLLRAAVLAGEIRCRAAQAVLPVARGEPEAGWVERARTLTVRALEAAVREARAGLSAEEDEWTRLRVGLSGEERAVLDEALSVAGKVLPGSSRAQRLEALAQEYLGEHPTEAGDDGGRAIGGMFRAIHPADQRERLRARLEAETERWSYLLRVRDVAAPDAGFEEATSARELDARLRELSLMRDSWDGVLGFGAYSVKRSGLWRILGFASFDHYCEERLGLAKRTVEQRAALEKRLWEVPALRTARDAGLSYEKLRLLSYLPGNEVEAWLPRAQCAHGGLAPPGARGPRRRADACGPGVPGSRAHPGRLAPRGGVPGRPRGRGMPPRRREVPRRPRPALPRDLEAAREEAEDPLAEGPGAGPRRLPGPGLQPAGGARAPRHAAVPRRRRRGREPRRGLRLPPPARDPRRVRPRPGAGAPPAGLGAGLTYAPAPKISPKKSRIAWKERRSDSGL